MSMLGFIKRICRDFDDPLVLKTLYCTFVRSTLEYASSIWNPQYAIHINRIESVQKKFVNFALRRLPWLDISQVPYNHRTIFKIMYHKTNYGSNEPLTNMMRLFNAYSSWFDLTDNRDKIKTIILNQLKTTN